MAHPIFPEIDVNRNDDEVVENPLLENFLKEFIKQMSNETSQLEASCEKLKKFNEHLQTAKDHHLNDIFTMTHVNMNESFLTQQLSQRIQAELNIFQMADQQVDGVLEDFQRDYMNWRITLEQQMQNTLADDELFELSQPEIETRIETLKKEAENAKNELNIFEEATRMENTLMEDDIQALLEEVNMLDSLKSEIGATQQRLMEELKEKQLKSQEDVNMLQQEISALKKKLELYE